MVVMGNPLGDVSAIDKLLKLGASLDMQDDEGWNCLHWAAYHSNVGAVEKLIEVAGSKSVMRLLTVKNKAGMTPIDVAVKEKQDGFVSWVRTTVEYMKR